jgi:hypothetical protein
VVVLFSFDIVTNVLISPCIFLLIAYIIWHLPIVFYLKKNRMARCHAPFDKVYFFIFTMASKFDSSLELSHFDQGILRIVWRNEKGHIDNTFNIHRRWPTPHVPVSCVYE